MKMIISRLQVALTHVCTRQTKPTSRPIGQAILLLAVVLLSGCANLASATTPKSIIPVPPFGSPIAVASASRAGMPNRLELPTLEKEIAVVELGWTVDKNKAGEIFSQWDVANNAAGWHKNSALVGQRGNIVLSGHNNVAGAVFRDLDKLKEGDQLLLWANGQRSEYRIAKVMIVPEREASAEQRRKNARWIAPTVDSRLTLVSCWPRNDNTHRIIVVAHPIPPADESRDVG